MQQSRQFKTDLLTSMIESGNSGTGVIHTILSLSCIQSFPRVYVERLYSPQYESWLYNTIMLTLQINHQHRGLSTFLSILAARKNDTDYYFYNRSSIYTHKHDVDIELHSQGNKGERGRYMF